MLDDFKYEDLKKLTNSELTVLASEIRSLIIDVVSKNGGHLSSNLGVVELTLAIHKVFDLPKDLLIFDVSHQIYTHKIITNRYNEFKTLRKFNGLSGFARRCESEFDAFEAGHSSTALSAGIGFLEADRINNYQRNVIALVGDASVVNGLSFEALNYLGEHKNLKMIIIINDNNMSVSKNVGALAKAFNKIRGRKRLSILRKIIPIRIKKMLKSYAYSNSFFDSLNLRYLEGIDGHNFDELIKFLTYAKNSDESIVLHVNTKKGCGYQFASEDFTGIWHSVAPFKVDTGIVSSADGISFGEEISKEIINLLDDDKNIIVLTPAMQLGSGLSELVKSKYSNRVLDFGIAEENACCVSSALSIAKTIPLVFCYSTFLQRAYDEIIHDIARSKTKVIFCIDRAGIISGDGDTHQGIYDVSFLKSIPNTTIYAPSSPNEGRLILNYLVNNFDSLCGPVFIRYPRTGNIFNEFNPLVDFNKIRVGDIQIVSYSTNFLEILNDQRFSRFGLTKLNKIHPLSPELIEDLLRGHKSVVIYEEVIESNSVSTQLFTHIAKNYNLNYPKVISMTIPNTYLPVGNKEEIKKFLKISLDDLYNLLKDVENIDN